MHQSCIKGLDTAYLLRNGSPQGPRDVFGLGDKGVELLEQAARQHRAKEGADDLRNKRPVSKRVSGSR